MTVRTYRGREMGALVARIRRELGSHAVIVATRESAAGFEIEAALEPPVAQGATADVSPHTRATWRGQGLSPEHEDRLARLMREANLRGGLAAALSSALEVNPQLPFNQRVVALIGATGVGKTTTIAKLAASLQRAFGARIGLIAADSYRVGAAHHLQSYASLLEAPFRVLHPQRPAREELRRAVDSLADCDLVFVDTAGCSARDAGRIEALAEQFQGADDVERMLVLPAPSNRVDLEYALSAFTPVGYERVIMTKLDESGFIGPVVNAAISSGKPLAFLTTGQRVPEDIEPASYARLAWMLERTLH